jgi:carbon storage regulator
MLILSRKRGERIVIGDDIVITVVGTRGDRVRLGFKCPDEIVVHREEVQSRIREKRLTRPPVELREKWHEYVETL